MEQRESNSRKRDIMIKLLIFVLGFGAGTGVTMIITLHKLKSLLY